ncbi:hypothetical protein MIMGU_mgv1a003545mg [Erythranthe guttata]|uniref:Uncharacterized protein n=1 Tax=Erythranthe guttata TaxID=4155 RepID=A0A022PRZ1_ERYGU|nr:hypothetical protein MIMGU_mgv1a003545mg [Erythranthe guttata]
MFSSKKKQIRANELELKPLVESREKLPRKICRIPTRVREYAGEFESRQVKKVVVGGSSTGETAESSETTPNSGGENANVIRKFMDESLLRFGPVYRVDQPSVVATKEKAWEHVVKKSLEKNGDEESNEELVRAGVRVLAGVVENRETGTAESSSNPLLRGGASIENSTDFTTNNKNVLETESANEIKEIYSTAMRKVEREAREMYDGDDDKLSDIGSSFRWMMIKDGCFFLQLALLILGCSEQLGYPANDPIFGKKHNKKDVKKWIEAMFHVANWDSPDQSSLCKKVLYEVLVLPALKRDQDREGSSLKERITPSSDLLHSLQNHVIGLEQLDRISSQYEVDDGQIDLEANEDEEVSDYRRIFTTETDDSNGEGASLTEGRIRLLLNAIGLSGSTGEDRKRIFPCATELKRAGIVIKKLENGEGARSICFNSYRNYLWPWAYLYLPVLAVDDNTETILRNLKTYELSQHQSERNRGEVSSYIRVMSDLIQTTSDVRLLEKNGVVQGSPDDDHVEKLPRILSRLSSEDVRLTNEFRILRRRIRDYSSPWIHYKGLISLVAFLTVLQTFVALLAYFKPPRP